MPLVYDIEEFRRNVAKAIEELEEVRSVSDKLTECTVDEIHCHLTQLQDLCEQVSIEIKRAAGQLMEINVKWGSGPLKIYSRHIDKFASVNDEGVAKFLDALAQVSQSQEQKSLKTPRLVKGNSAKLKKNLIDKGVPYKEGYQAHHIIPSAVANNSDLVLNAIEKAGFDIDCAENGIFLPPNVLGEDLLPAHRGSHPKYSDFVQDILSQEWQDLKKSQLQNDEAELMRAIAQTIEYLRGAIAHHAEAFTNEAQIHSQTARNMADSAHRLSSMGMQELRYRISQLAKLNQASSGFWGAVEKGVTVVQIAGGLLGGVVSGPVPDIGLLGLQSQEDLVLEAGYRASSANEDNVRRREEELDTSARVANEPTTSSPPDP
jgi:hypothetical protein